MIAFIDEYREAYGVEPICRVLPIAPSTYHQHVAQRQDPSLLSQRARRDRDLKPEIARVFTENFAVYGVRKVWRQMNREGFAVARCTVARLMQEMGLQGVIRGKPVRTTISDKATPCPQDHVNRKFYAPAPNMLWVSDFTYVATWAGFVYVAFVIDTYARRIVGWRASRTAHASFVLDALEQALHDRRPAHRGGLIHHSDRGSQYVSIKYTERLAEAGIEPSVGSVGDSYDNALAETINGLYKAEVIHRRGPWRSFEAVEYATLEWVDWFNHRRLLEPIGNVPPAEAEDRFYAMLDESAWQLNLTLGASDKPGAVHLMEWQPFPKRVVRMGMHDRNDLTGMTQVDFRREIGTTIFSSIELRPSACATLGCLWVGLAALGLNGMKHDTTLSDRANPQRTS
jgi:putative transposase